MLLDRALHGGQAADGEDARPDYIQPDSFTHLQLPTS